MADRGVIPRLLSNIFRRAKKTSRESKGSTTVDVHLSYYEIYNDKVLDLLEPPEKRASTGLPLREKDGKTFVVGLTERLCQDLKDFEKLYIEANTNRVTASTKLNAHSSRSHAILRVKLTQTTGQVVRESVASAIDLAGSEDNRRTDNGKERLVESAAINKSLFVLSQCIDAISRGDKRIPYRESKMTRILSLGQNNGITTMILNLAPVRSYHLDTLSSLNVSSRAKRIEVREIENEVVFKTQPPKAVASSVLNIARQPLRPIASTHNSLAGALMSKEKDKEKERPTKLFQVYSDKQSKGVSMVPKTQIVANTSRRHNTKRPIEAEQTQNRPRTSRSAVTSRSQASIAKAQLQSKQSITAAEIEAMVEKKVVEILATRAAEEIKSNPSSPLRSGHVAPTEVNPISDEVRQRLEALEQKVNATAKTGDERSPGLRLLMQARRAKEKGDDEATLRLYEEAAPYFPGERRLESKIEKLRARILARKAAEQVDCRTHFDTLEAGDELDMRKTKMMSPNRPRMIPYKSPRKGRKRKAQLQLEDEDSEYHAEAAADDEYNSHIASRKSERKYCHKRNKSVSENPNPTEDATPANDNHNVVTMGISSESCVAITTARVAAPEAKVRAEKMLLAAINSRDEVRIRGLHGFGAKRTQDLVTFMASILGKDREMESLAQLKMAPGMGGRTIDRALEGLVASVAVGISSSAS